jgi:phosphoglucomutase/phosphomannomutase
LRLDGQPSVVVAYDVREFHDLRGHYRGVDGILTGLTSRDLAKAAALAYAANGVVAHVVGPLEEEPGAPVCRDRFISTPELSFLIRELGAAGGLNVSASHNHPDDNGTKFYNLHGGQEVPPDDERLLKVVEQVSEVSTMPYAEARHAGLVRLVPRRLHRSYITLNTALCATHSRSAKVAFTPLCGTGSTTVGEALSELGFELIPVPEQSVYDGSFASIPYRIANPEVPEALGRLVEVAQASGCDLGFATDPDADRLGLIAPDARRKFVYVNGDQIGILLLQSVLSARTRAGTLAARPVFLSTLLTSSLQRRIARRYGCQVVGDLMVGFKYLADVLRHLEEGGRFPRAGVDADPNRAGAQGDVDDFICGCEESHGYLLTPRIRDKDACGPAVHLAGRASQLKDAGSNLPSLLRDIFRVYGYERKQVRVLVMEGITGLAGIRHILSHVRQAPPGRIGRFAVHHCDDYQKLGGPARSSTDWASRDLLLFTLAGDDALEIRVALRPSGTEPKVKIYVEVGQRSAGEETLDEATQASLASVTDADLDRVIAHIDQTATEVATAFMSYCLRPEVLGRSYPDLGEEWLLVSDLVPVEQRVALGARILPELVAKLSDTSPIAVVHAWLEGELRTFGADPKLLVRDAVRAWLERARAAGTIGDDLAETVRALFDS